MSDITKCSGLNCPVKMKCKRHTANDSLVWQSWFMEVPGVVRNIDGKKTFTCEMFWSDQFDLEEIIFGE